MTPVDASESPDSTMPTSVHPVPTSVHSVEGRGRGREAAICQAALELLAEVGYDRMSMDAVALRARAGKATIYRHWPGSTSWSSTRSGREPPASTTRSTPARSAVTC